MNHRFAAFKPRQRPPGSGRALLAELPEGLRRYVAAAEAAVAEPFKGVTADGHVTPGLFRLGKTGVSTRPIRDAAEAFLGALTPDERARAMFPVETDAWRRWSNIHPYLMRHGLCLDTMAAAPRDRALALLRESLSAQGFETARGVMKLNEAIAEITGKPEEYGEWLYWLSLMGTPSADQPWGWQLDGHHLIVNCFVLGDQVVMTPMFMGSEPVEAHAGKYAGTRVFAAEEADALALVQALAPDQQRRTILGDTLPGDVFTTGFRDNLTLGYEGIRHDELTRPQQTLLRGLLELYVTRMRPGHAEVRMEEVERHLAETRFAWMGGFHAESAFYYRLHSPVILVEFDHQRGIALDNDEPSRNHIHTLIRTPNGNDYGRDLLRQHHEQYDHSRPGHAHSPPA
jgi:uncharacterized protein DUF3500